MALQQPQGKKGVNTQEGYENEQERLNNPIEDLGFINSFELQPEIQQSLPNSAISGGLLPNFDVQAAPQQGKQLWESQYDDPYTISLSDAYDLQTRRAANQSDWDRWFNHLEHGVSNFGTGLIGTAGFMVGGLMTQYDLLKRVTNQLKTDESWASSLKGFVDNPIINWANDIQQWSLEEFVNYNPSYVNDMYWYERLSHGGLVELSGQMLELAGTVASFVVGGQWATGLVRGGVKLAGGSLKALYNGIRGGKGATSLSNTIKKSLSIDDGRGLFSVPKPSWKTQLMSSPIEASMEGSMAASELKEQLRERYKDKYNDINKRYEFLTQQYENGQLSDNDYNIQLGSIENELKELDKLIDMQAIEGGVYTFLGNIPWLALSNTISYAHLGKTGLYAQTNHLVNGALKNLGAIGAKDFAKKFFSEGIYEEMGQGVISQTAKDYSEWALDNYFNGIRDIEDSEKVAKFFSTFVSNALNTYTDIDNPLWEEGFLGGLMGGIGFVSPRSMTYKDKDGKTHYRLPFTLEGGFMEGVNKEKMLRKEAAHIKEVFQNTVLDEKWLANFHSMVRQGKLNEIYQQAIDDGDFFTAKNAEFASLIDVLVAAKRSGSNEILSLLLDIDLNKLAVDDEYVRELAAGFDVTGQDGSVKNQFRDANGIIDVKNARRQIEQNFKQTKFLIDTINQAYEQASKDTNGNFGLIKDNEGTKQSIIEDLTYTYAMANSYMYRYGEMISNLNTVIDTTLSSDQYVIPDKILNSKFILSLKDFAKNYKELIEKYKDPSQIPYFKWIKYLDTMFINSDTSLLKSLFFHDRGQSEATINAFTVAFDKFRKDVVEHILSRSNIPIDRAKYLKPLDYVAISNGKALINSEGELVMELAPGNWYKVENIKDLTFNQTLTEDNIHTLYDDDKYEEIKNSLSFNDQHVVEYKLNSHEQKLVDELKSIKGLYSEVFDIEKCLRKAYELRTFLSRMHNNPNEFIRHYDELAKSIADSRLKSLYIDKIEKAINDGKSAQDILNMIPSWGHNALLYYLVYNHRELIPEFEKLLKEKYLQSVIFNYYLHYRPEQTNYFRIKRREHGRVTEKPNNIFADLYRKDEFVDKLLDKAIEINESDIISDQLKEELDVIFAEFAENDNLRLQDLLDSLSKLKDKITNSLKEDDTVYLERDLEPLTLMLEESVATVNNNGKTNYWGVEDYFYDQMMKKRQELENQQNNEEKPESTQSTPRPTNKIPPDDDDEGEEDEGGERPAVFDPENPDAETGLENETTAQLQKIEEQLRIIKESNANDNEGLAKIVTARYILSDKLNWDPNNTNANKSLMAGARDNLLKIDELARQGTQVILNSEYQEGDPNFNVITMVDESLIGDESRDEVVLPFVYMVSNGMPNVLQKGEVHHWVSKAKAVDNSVNVEPDNNTIEKADDVIKDIENSMDKFIEFSISHDSNDDSVIDSKEQMLTNILNKLESLTALALESLSMNKSSSVIETTIQLLYDKVQSLQSTIDNIKNENEELKGQVETLKTQLKNDVQVTSETILSSCTTGGIIITETNTEKKERPAPNRVVPVRSFDPSSSGERVYINGFSMMKPFFEHPAKDGRPGLRQLSDSDKELSHVLIPNPEVKPYVSGTTITEGNMNYEMYYEMGAMKFAQEGHLAKLLDSYADSHNGERPTLHVFYRIFKNPFNGRYLRYRYVSIEINEDTKDFIQPGAKPIEYNHKQYQVIGSLSYERQDSLDFGDYVLHRLNDMFSERYRKNPDGTYKEDSELYEPETFYYVGTNEGLFELDHVSEGTYVMARKTSDDQTDTDLLMLKNERVELGQLFQEAGFSNGITEENQNDISLAIFHNSGDIWLSSAIVKSDVPTSLPDSIVNLTAGDILLYVRLADGKLHPITLRNKTIDSLKILNTNNAVSVLVKNALKTLLYYKSTVESKKQAYSILNKFLRLPKVINGVYPIRSGFGENGVVTVTLPSNPNNTLTINRIYGEPGTIRTESGEDAYDAAMKQILDKLTEFGVIYNTTTQTLDDNYWINSLIQLGAYTTLVKSLYNAMPTIFYTPAPNISKATITGDNVQLVQPSSLNDEDKPLTNEQRIELAFYQEMQNSEQPHITRLSQDGHSYLLYENGDDVCVYSETDKAYIFDEKLIEQLQELKKQKNEQNMGNNVVLENNITDEDLVDIQLKIDKSEFDDTAIDKYPFIKDLWEGLGWGFSYQEIFNKIKEVGNEAFDLLEKTTENGNVKIAIKNGLLENLKQKLIC